MANEETGMLPETDMLPVNDQSEVNELPDNPEADVAESLVNDGVIKDDDPTGVKKRLHAQATKHRRALRDMQQQIDALRAQQAYPGEPAADSYVPSQFEVHPDDPEEVKIQKAVALALQMKDQEEQQRQAASSQAHVQKRYSELERDLDRAADKYDDFDDVVRGDQVPFTPAIRDALLFVDNPGEVAYKLGKNVSELARISKLHPLDQAREVNKLAFALMNGPSGRSEAVASESPFNPIKANPSKRSSAITDNTSPAAIRQMMKSGAWK